LTDADLGPPMEEPADDVDVAVDAVVDADDADIVDAEVIDVDAEPIVELDDGPRDGADGVAEAEALVVDDLNSLERERDEYLDALRRLQADFENFKKRMMRQQTELLERAGEGLVEKLLPVLDAVDYARQHGVGEGIEQVASALLDVLQKEGLERIDPVGQPFDPTEHEAVAHEPAADGDDHHDGKQVVANLLRAGYRWKGKLLRPAMVSVRG
jgi:molecular chaperone GrpE